MDEIGSSEKTSIKIVNYERSRVTLIRSINSRNKTKNNTFILKT